MSETQQMPSLGAPANPPVPPVDPAVEHCEQCQAPVESSQRYCVNCGNHRRHVPDPAARFMSQASAHVRRPALPGALPAVPGAAVPVSTPRGGIGLLGALAIALIPVAAAVGVSVGHSDNGGDAKLIQALEHQRAQTTTTFAGAAATPSSSASASVSSTRAGHVTRRRTGHRTRSHAAAHQSASTTNGKVSQIAGSKVTAAQQAAGSAEAAKVQTSTGASYVQAGNNLPSSVVVGP